MWNCQGYSSSLCSVKVGKYNCKWQVLCWRRADLKQEHAVEFVPVSSSVITPLIRFIFTDHDSRWIAVAFVFGRDLTPPTSRVLRWSDPRVMAPLRRSGYLFCLTVTVCLMFFCLLVWTEMDPHHIELCVISNHNIKAPLRGKARLWQGDIRATVIWYLESNDPLQKYPN